MSRPTDSAGQPWEGRRFESNAHTSDDGSAPEAMTRVLEKFARGLAGEADVVDVVRESRFLIPLIAEAGDIGVDEDGRTFDKSQDLSIVTVKAPDGRNALPVFTSVAAMNRWNPLARPVPSDGIRVALAAASEKTDVVVIDPTSETQFAIRRPAVWAIAQGNPWTPSYADEAVREAFETSIGTELGVLSVVLKPGDPGATLLHPELAVHLELVNGLTRDELDAILRRMAQRWAADDLIAQRVDSLTVKLIPSS